MSLYSTQHASSDRYYERKSEGECICRVDEFNEDKEEREKPPSPYKRLWV